LEALVLFSFLLVLLDGYDITAAAFAAPFLVKEWGITSMAALAGVSKGASDHGEVAVAGGQAPARAMTGVDW
jgi:hypothetical protein